MARIRSIHPSFFTDEAVVSCSPLGRILYIGLWTDADDQGLFEWKPLQIRMRLLPGDDADVAVLLSELAGAGLIAPLESGGKKLGAIRYFRRFQRPKKPNAVFLLPPEWRTYVGLDGGDPEPDGDGDAEGRNRFDTGGEIPPQMEDGGCRVEEEGEGSPEPLSATIVELPRPERRVAPPPARGSRLSGDWSPSPTEIAYATQEYGFTEREAGRMADNFRDFWIAVPGQKGVKLDWSATWRRWVREERERKPRKSTAGSGRPRIW
jgi:hypothetical protein